MRVRLPRFPFVFLLLAAAVLFAGALAAVQQSPLLSCISTRVELERLVEENRRCVADADCAVYQESCAAFDGCIAIRASSLDLLRPRAEEYARVCGAEVPSCSSCSAVRTGCVAGLCTAVGG